MSGALMMAHGPLTLCCASLAGRWRRPPRWPVCLACHRADLDLRCSSCSCQRTHRRRRRRMAPIGRPVDARIRRGALPARRCLGRRHRRLDASATCAAALRRPLNSMPRSPERRDSAHARPALPRPHQDARDSCPPSTKSSNLTRVVRELRRVAPDLDILVVNDGSTDGTADLLPSLGIDWLTLPQRVGVGGAVRAGLRYAVRQGYEYVVRIDGDGQHRASDVLRMLAPVARGRLDASIGSRFVPTMRPRPGRRLTLRRLSQAALAGCLTVWTRQRFTDPTSGFWLFGPRAVRLLGRPPSNRVRGTGARAFSLPQRTARRRSSDSHAASTRRPDVDHSCARHAGIRAHAPGADDGAGHAKRRGPHD